MNSAVDTESCSELPLLITKLLKDLGVSYQIQRDRPNFPAAQRVQAVLLDDAIGDKREREGPPRVKAP